MQATVELPEPLLRQLEQLAKSEGATTADVIRQFVEEGLERKKLRARKTGRVPLPLIPATESGLIQPISGVELDDLLAREDFTT